MDNFPGLVIYNNGQPTRLTTPGSKVSAVDITILSSNVMSRFEWTVMEDTYGSDHFPILTEIKRNGEQSEKSNTLKWKIDDTKWELCTELLSQCQ